MAGRGRRAGEGGEGEGVDGAGVADELAHGCAGLLAGLFEGGV
jgi:hypothetical protein